VVAAVATVCLMMVIGAPGARAAPTRAAPGSPPSFAYYYIWYQPTSWLRAKEDYPLLGRYSSDDPVVMGRHVTMAKAAGLTGFLVSWKGTRDLDARLDALVHTAKEHDFKLEIVYQGQDLHRRPLPVGKVAADLEYLADRYARSPVFDTFSKPVVVITGTDRFTLGQLRRATAGVRDRLRVLASAKNVEGYRRTASVTEGDAYYWSSVDPATPSYARKIQEMSRAVHADGGLWLAPAPAGFDARLVGGHRVVPRRGGETLRRAIGLARRSAPDAVGVISWNDFSENSDVEPSQLYGGQELTALANALGGAAQVPRDLASTDLSRRNTGMTGFGALVVMLLVGAPLNLVVTIVRGRRERPRRRPDGVGPPRADRTGSS
jgi:hypothetical protein